MTMESENPEIGVCSGCGMPVYRLDAHVLVSGQVLHAACTGAPHTERPDGPGAWATMSTRGQVGLGDVQREPVIRETTTTGWINRVFGRFRRA